MITMLAHSQELRLAGLKGTVSSINAIIAGLPEEDCPKLDTDLTQLEVLSHALSIMTHNLNKTINKE